MMNIKKRSILSSINKYRGEIMGFAAVWIFILHEWQLLSIPWSRPYYVERFIKDTGFIGVDMFLLLSGMGLSYAIEKHSLAQFYLRRFKRLAIPVLAAAVLRIFVSRWNLTYFLRCLSGYEFLTGHITAFIWYVYAIAVFYLIFPMYWRCFVKSRKKCLFTFFALLVWYLVFGIILRNVFSDTTWLVINRVPVFLLGVLFGWLERNPDAAPSDKSFVIAAAAALPVGVVTEYYCSVYGIKLLMPMPTVFVPAFLTGTALVLLLAFLYSGTKPKARFFKYLGGISFELYCLQEAMGDWLIPVLSGKMPNLAVNLLLFAMVLLCAAVLHRLSEKVLKIIKL